MTFFYIYLKASNVAGRINAHVLKYLQMFDYLAFAFIFFFIVVVFVGRVKG